MAEALTAFFTYTAVGLSASFRDLSYGNPSSWEWNFGDTTSSTDQHPTHDFTEEGFHSVTLTITLDGVPPLISESTQRVGISNAPFECPQMSTYEAVMMRIPSTLQVAAPPPLIYSLIRKWQKIIGKLVTPEIPEVDIHNELRWPLLPNELVIELVSLDIFEGRVKNYLLGLTGVGSGSSSSASSGGGGLKAIVTGPSEVQWYDNAASVSQAISAVTKTGGFIDQSKNQACTLAGMLKISLMICPDLNKPVFSPTIAKKRK